MPHEPRHLYWLTCLVAAVAGAAVAIHPYFASILAGLLLFGLLSTRPALTIPLVVLLLTLPTSGFWTVLGAPVTRRLLVMALVSWGLAVAWGQRRDKDVEPRLPAAVLLFGLIPLFTLVQLLYTEFPSAVTVRAFDWLVALGLLIIIFSVAPQGRGALESPLKGLVIIGSFQALLGMLQFVVRGPFLMESALSEIQLMQAWNTAPLFRGLGTMYHANSLALFLVLVIPATFFLLQSQHTSSRILAQIALPILAVGVLATLSRAGAICLGIALLALSYLASSRQRAKAIAWVFATVTILAISVPATMSVLDDMTDRLFGNTGSARDRGADAAREASADATTAAFLDRPLLGHGYGTSSSVGGRYGAQSDFGAHNAYLDILQGGGVVLATAFAVMIVVVWRALITSRGIRSPLIAAFVAFAVYGFAETVLQGLPLAVFAIYFGILIHPIHAVRPASELTVQTNGAP